MALACQGCGELDETVTPREYQLWIAPDSVVTGLIVDLCDQCYDLLYDAAVEPPD
jgi:hypothetical protein